MVGKKEKLFHVLKRFFHVTVNLRKEKVNSNLSVSEFFAKSFGILQNNLKTNPTLRKIISNPRSYSNLRKSRVTEFVNEYFTYIHVWIYYRKFKDIIKYLGSYRGETRLSFIVAQTLLDIWKRGMKSGDRKKIGRVKFLQKFVESSSGRVSDTPIYRVMKRKNFFEILENVFGDQADPFMEFEYVSVTKELVGKESEHFFEGGLSEAEDDIAMFKKYYEGGKKIIPFVVDFLPKAGYNMWYAGEKLVVVPIGNRQYKLRTSCYPDHLRYNGELVSVYDFYEINKLNKENELDLMDGSYHAEHYTHENFPVKGMRIDYRVDSRFFGNETRLINCFKSKFHNLRLVYHLKYNYVKLQFIKTLEFGDNFSVPYGSKFWKGEKKLEVCKSKLVDTSVSIEREIGSDDFRRIEIPVTEEEKKFRRWLNENGMKLITRKKMLRLARKHV